MHKFSKFFSLLILVLAGMAAAVNINGTDYFFTVSSSSAAGGGAVAIISQSSASTAVNSTMDATGALDCSQPLGEWADVNSCLNNIMANSSASNAVELGSDLDFGGVNDNGGCNMDGFVPLTWNGGAYGVFDGKNHTVNGLCIVKTSDQLSDNAGFFKPANFAVQIKNLNFDSAYISLEGGDMSSYAGVLMGWADVSGEISNVTVRHSTVKALNAGSLFGLLRGRSSGFNISGIVLENDSVVVEDANALGGCADGVACGGISVGGMIGVWDYSANASLVIDSNMVKMRNVVVKDNSSFIANDAQGTLSFNAGGVAGMMRVPSNFKVSLSMNDAVVSGGINVGGMFGVVSNSFLLENQIPSENFDIENVNFNGSVSGSKNVGGLVGKADLWNNGVFYNISNVKVSGQVSGDFGNAGGLVGQVLYSHPSSSASMAVENAEVEVNISVNSGNAGGVVGETYFSRDSDFFKLVIEKSVYKGRIDAVNFKGLNAGSFVGYSESCWLVISQNKSSSKWPSYSGQAGANVGYILGDVSGGELDVWGNYHYGAADADVVSGIGSWTRDDWENPSSLSQSMKPYRNFRNAIEGSLTATGDLAYSSNKSSISNGAYNGIISVADMQTDMFADFLGRRAGSLGENNSVDYNMNNTQYWTRADGVNDGLPFKADGAYKPIRHVSLVVDGNPGDVDFRDDVGFPYEGTGVGTDPEVIFYLFTDYNHKLNANDVDAMNSVLTDKQVWRGAPSLSAENVYDGYARYKLKDVVTYNVVYKVCLLEKYAEGDYVTLDETTTDDRIRFVGKPVYTYTTNQDGILVPWLLVARDDGSEDYLMPYGYVVGGDEYDFNADGSLFDNLESWYVYQNPNSPQTIELLYDVGNILPEDNAFFYVVASNMDESSTNASSVSLYPTYNVYKADGADTSIVTSEQAGYQIDFTETSFVRPLEITKMQPSAVGYDLKDYTVTFGKKNTTATLTQKNVTAEYFASPTEIAAGLETTAWVKNVADAETEKVVLDSLVAGVYMAGRVLSDFKLEFLANYAYKEYNLTFNLNVNESDLENVVLGSSWAAVKEKVTLQTEKVCPSVYKYDAEYGVFRGNMGCGLTGEMNSGSANFAQMIQDVVGTDTVFYISWSTKINAEKDSILVADKGEDKNLTFYTVSSTGNEPSAVKGVVTLIQKIDEENVIKRSSEDVFVCNPNTSSTSTYNELYVPKVDDALSFSVKSKAEPGYSFKVKDFVYGTENGLTENTGNGNSWGLTIAGGDTVLKINPAQMSNMYFVTESKLQDYKVAFVSPNDANDMLNHVPFIPDDYLGEGWPDTLQLNVESEVEFPTMDVAGQCADWASVESYQQIENGTRGSSLMPYVSENRFSATETNSVYPIVFTEGCDFTQTVPYFLKKNSQGTLQFVQIIKAGDDAEELVHEFTEDTESADKMEIPSDGTYRVLVRAVPNGDFAVDKISYEIQMNGNIATVLLEDGAEDILDGSASRTYSVSFKPYGPYFVHYKLELGPNDSSLVYFNSDVSFPQSISYNSEAPEKLLSVFRTDKCLAGWSKKTASKRGDSDSVFTQLGLTNLGDFSDDEDNPTVLYAVWKDRVAGSDCEPLNADAAGYVSLYAAKVGETGEISGGLNGSVTISQTFDGKVFRHELSDEGVVIPNDSYEFELQAEPCVGCSFGPVTLQAWSGATPLPANEITFDKNGVAQVQLEKSTAGELPYKWVFDMAADEISFQIVFDGNTDASVFYGVKWTGSAEIKPSMISNGNLWLPEDNFFEPALARTDACLEGWKLKDGRGVYKFLNTNNFASFVEESLADRETEFSQADNVAQVKLYANWVSVGDGCSPSNVLVKPMVSTVAGSFVLFDGIDSLKVPAEGLLVPDYFEPQVYFVANSGITAANKIEAKAQGVDETESWNTTIENGERIEFKRGIVSTAWEVDEIELSVDYSSELVKFAYNTNAEGKNVFYAAGWTNEGGFDMNSAAEDLTLPTGLFRDDAVLKGWAFKADENAADKIYRNLTGNMFDEYVSEKSSLTETSDNVILYAVWDELATPLTYTVIPSKSAVGTLKLVQEVDGIAVNYEVPANGGLKVPAGANLAFAIDYTPTTGHEILGEIAAADLTGFIIPDGIVDNVIILQSNVMIVVNERLISYKFVFNANVPDSSLVFYGDGWSPALSSSFGLGERLQNEIYRTDKVLAGWAFDKNETSGFFEITEERLAEFEQMSANGPVRLYAVWEDPADARATYTIKSADVDAGVLTLLQDNGYGDTVYHELANGALVVPAEKLTLDADFVPFAGWTLVNDGLYYVVDNSGKILGTLDGKKLAVADNSIVKAPVAATKGTFAFKANVASESDLFYGDNWVGSKSFDMSMPEAEREFPKLYRPGFNMVGWGFKATSTADEAYNAFDEDFVSAYVAMRPKPLTLYAVWEISADVNYHVVTLSDSSGQMGSMYMTRSVGGVDRNYFVTVEGLKVPDANLGFYNQTFKAKRGYVVKLDMPELSVTGNADYNPQTGLTHFTGDAVYRANYEPMKFRFSYNYNADGENVFEGDESAETLWTLDSLPTEFYRADACLEGWAFNADGVAFKAIDENFLAEMENRSYAGDATNVLYGVWGPAGNGCEIESAVVTNSNSVAGSMTLERKNSVYDVGAGLAVPTSVNGKILSLSFVPNFVVNEGYSFDGALTIDGKNVADGFVVDEDKKIKAGVRGGDYQFAFDVNTKAYVFYGDGWVESGAYDVAMEPSALKFPTGIYRTDAKLLGWALSANSSKFYSQYDGEFISAVKQAENLGMNVSTLYAIWDRYAAVDVDRIWAENVEAGSFVVSQYVNGREFSMDVGPQGILVPHVESGLTFSIKFETGMGFSLDSGKSILIEGVQMADTVENGSAVNIRGNVLLDALVKADDYYFVFNVNAGNSNVFYGDGWRSSAALNLSSARDFVTEVYCADKGLAGWSLTADGSGRLYTDLTAELIEDLESDTTELFAVWDDALKPETYKVTFEQSEVGKLTLAQIVEGDTLVYEVGEDGLDVPVVPEGFKFKIAFVVGAGYTLLADADKLYAVGEKGDTTSIKNNQLVVNQDVAIAVPVNLEKFPLVFDAGRNDVIMGEDWVTSGLYAVDSASVKNMDLPRYIYTADACIAGWTFGPGEELYTRFTSELVYALKRGEKSDKNGYVLKARWIDAESCASGKGAGDYTRVRLLASHGSVEFLENRDADGLRTIAHNFAKDNTMLLPASINGSNLKVLSRADSSFVMDSLVFVRGGDKGERYTYADGSALPYNLENAEFTAYYSKSNKVDVEIVDMKMETSGNAVRLSFKTSAFEVTRGVSARILVLDALGNIPVDTLLTDSIKASPDSLSWSKFPMNLGDYTVMVELADGIDTVWQDTNFSVSARIASVGADSWQMISMAVVDTAQIKWDGDQVFFWWDELGEPGEYWQYKEFARGNEIVDHRGVWYSSLAGRSLPLAHEVAVEGDVTWELDSLYSGWNLVANPYGWKLNIYNDNQNALKDENEKSDVEFARYNPATGGYEPAFVLEPFEAVWAKVSAPTSWHLKGVPEFEESPFVVARKARAFAKMDGKSDWSIQAVLEDRNGRKDSWNILGVSPKPFASEEPPAALGDFVNLSIIEGKRALAKSFKQESDDYEWSLLLSASSDRAGELYFAGVDALRSLGYRVYVTLDGKTVEMQDGERVKVMLKASGTNASVRVTAGKAVVASAVKGLRMTQDVKRLSVRFEVTGTLAGSRQVVDLLDLDGKVVKSVSGKAVTGTNLVSLDAPRAGLYMLRVRVASQQAAGKVLVR